MSLILLAVAIGLFFWWRTVTNDQRLADARNLALNGSDVGLRNPELALLLSIEAGMIGLQERRAVL